MIVTDRSGSNVGIRCAGKDPCSFTIPGDGGTSQQARVPSNRPYTEISQVEGEGENCSALTADQGGEAGEGHVNEAHKCAGVGTHGQLMRAHQMGSYTKTDHEALNGDNSSGPMPMQTCKDAMSDMGAPAAKAESSRTPTIYNGGRSSFSNSSSRPLGNPMKSAGPGVVAETTSKLATEPVIYVVPASRL